jgi:hypothetical protein
MPMAKRLVQALERDRPSFNQSSARGGGTGSTRPEAAER